MGKKDSTVTQKADPWKPARPALSGAIGEAQSLYDRGDFTTTPYGGPRVASFGDTARDGHAALLERARLGAPLTQEASGFLSSAMDGRRSDDRLAAVRDNALGAAIPAAVAQFSGSGMTNSSQAMDYVGRAATEAVAPYDYAAFNAEQGRGMQAAGMAGDIERAGYVPGSIMSTVGQQQDAMAQAQIDADMARYYEGEAAPAQGISNYSNLLAMLGGMGGATSQTTPGPSMGQQVGGAGLGGLATYGALAANPVTAPFAAIGGVGAGLLGLL